MRRQPMLTIPLLLIVLLPWLATAAEAQSDGVDGPGEAAPWSVEGKPRQTGPAPRGSDRDRARHMDGYWGTPEPPKREQRLRCRILEVEELGKIYVRDLSGAAPYWIQLPREVKIRTGHAKSFDGRKKLTIDDLEAGQRLVVKLKDGTDEIVKVVVTPAKA